MNKKVLLGIVFCSLSFGAMHAMDFIDPTRGDLKPGDLEGNVIECIGLYVSQKILSSEDEATQAFITLKNKLGQHLQKCNHDQLDIYLPCIELKSSSDRVKTVSLIDYLRMYRDLVKRMSGDIIVVERLKEIEKMLIDYQPEILYLQEKVSGKVCEATVDDSDSEALVSTGRRPRRYLLKIGLSAAFIYGMYRLFFAEKEQGKK